MNVDVHNPRKVFHGAEGGGDKERVCQSCPQMEVGLFVLCPWTKVGRSGGLERERWGGLVSKN